MKGYTIVALVLTGCGLSEDAFRTEQVRLSCQRDQQCHPDVEDARDCATLEPPAQSTIIDCTFDADQASTCLDAIPTAQCATVGHTPPVSCSRVFVDCVNNAN